ncbi:hypothetical protein QE400_003713 [Xanthomonas sacchari]|nr:hypothetical protein [Xanthomonas sacchari]
MMLALCTAVTFLRPVRAGQVEGVADDALGALAGHLGHRHRGLAVGGHFLAFAQVGAFGVLAHGDQVHAGAEARLGVRERLGRTHVGVQVELAAHGHVDRAEALAHRRGQRALQRHLVLADRLQRGGRQQVAVLLQRNQARVGVFVGEAGVQRVEHEQRGVHDLRADAIATDDRDCLRHRVAVSVQEGGAPPGNRGCRRKEVSAVIMPEAGEGAQNRAAAGGKPRRVQGTSNRPLRRHAGRIQLALQGRRQPRQA